MDFFTELEISQGSNWFSHPHQNDPHKMMEISPFDSFFDEFSTTPELKYESKKLYEFEDLENINFDFNLNEFEDLENINFDFNLPLHDEHFQVDKKPLDLLLPEPTIKSENHGFVASVKKEFEEESEEEMQLEMELTPLPSGKEKSSSSALEADEIKKHFDSPISVAAEKMNVGVSYLKKRCRELKIKRWPYRKFKSLKSLINNLKEMGLENEVVEVEKQKKWLENFPNMELNAETLRLRKACYKATYEKRRIMIHID